MQSLLTPRKRVASFMFAAMFTAFGCGDDTTDGEDAVCGNGAVESGEQCDDGNTDAGDGCSATCKDESTSCGDGTTDAGEECDDGNTDAGDGCSATCTNETSVNCGNGTTDDGETCDDGNTTAGDGCSATCQLEGACGDGIQNEGEECDDGNSDPLDGCENDCTPSPAEVACETLAPVTGTCAVTPGDGTKLIEGDVLGPYTIFRGGKVVVDAGGKITCVGCDCTAPAATKISCPDAVISPGLINTHEHITFAKGAPYNDIGERYEHRHDWRTGANGHTKIPSSGSSSADQIRWGELRFLMSGATSLVGSGSATGFLRNLDRNDQEGLGVDPVHFETFPLGDSGGQTLTMGCGYPDIDSQMSIAMDSAYFPHIAEGIGATAQNEFTCVDDDDAMHDLLESQSAFIHAVGLDPAEYLAMAAAGTSLIWSPRSNVTLYGNTALVTVAARVGVNIALGTDWIPTGSMNMFRELTCADSLNTTYYDKFFTDRQLWQMVTWNAAKALHLDDTIGVLRPGTVADIAIYDASTKADYRAIIEGEAKTLALVMRGGKPLFGDATVISALATGCDTIDVCTSSKQLCTMSEVNKTYAALKAAGGAAYNDFYCGEPLNEPSCVPTRPVAAMGSTTYSGIPSATDADGDGIADAMDNCPKVFNPVRPMDGGAQPNVDGDTDGDACDPCPLNANTTVCAILPPGDSDGDGVPNATDNCPSIANMNQADGDTDGKGDVCDACPTDSNPGDAACPTTIYAIKSGAATGKVAIKNALVTGCGNAKGYFLQVKQGDAGYMGSDHSGVFVYNPTVDCAMIKVGDRVDIGDATVSNFFGQIQLTFAMPTVLSSGETPPTPVAVTAAQVSGTTAGPLEGVVVQVTGAAVSNIAPAPGPGDAAPTNEFEITGGLRVNDFLFSITPFPTAGTVYTSLAGILDYRNGNQKLEPRGASDVVLGAASLAGFSEQLTFARVGQTALPSFPTALRVQLTAPVAANTFIGITSNNAGLTIPGNGVTVLAGNASAEVPLSATAAAADVTLTATYLAVNQTTHVRVLAAAEQPTTMAMVPNMITLPAGGAAVIEVAFDIPAPVGGAVVNLAVAPGSAGTLPPSVTIPEGQDSATFTYTDGAMVSAASITASFAALTAQADITVTMGSAGLVINEVDYDSVGNGDADEFVEIFNAGAAPVSLANLAVVFVSGSASAPEYGRVDLSSLGTLAPGQYLVVGSSSVLNLVVPPALEIAFPDDTNQIQNGAPDAVGLINTATMTVIDVLSYEGSVSAGHVTGFPMTVDFVEAPVLATATADNNVSAASLIRFPNGTDTNHAATDWKVTTTPTPGTINQ